MMREHEEVRGGDGSGWGAAVFVLEWDDQAGEGGVAERHLDRLYPTYSALACYVTRRIKSEPDRTHLLVHTQRRWGKIEMKKRTQQRFIAALLMVLLTACHSWRPTTVSPQRLIAEEEESPIRVVLSDGTELTLRNPTIQHDSIITGRVRFGTENLLVRDVSRIEVQRFSLFRTVGVVVLPFAIFAGLSAFSAWYVDATR